MVRSLLLDVVDLALAVVVYIPLLLLLLYHLHGFDLRITAGLTNSNARCYPFYFAYGVAPWTAGSNFIISPDRKSVV